MPYALRNETGEIIALTATPSSDADILLHVNDPEVVQFLLKNASTGEETSKRNMELLAQDFQQIRIVEDLIDLLTTKGVILFSELPIAAQEKILKKKSKREQKEESNDIIVSDENPLL